MDWYYYYSFLCYCKMFISMVCPRLAMPSKTKQMMIYWLFSNCNYGGGNFLPLLVLCNTAFSSRWVFKLCWRQSPWLELSLCANAPFKSSIGPSPLMDMAKRHVIEIDIIVHLSLSPPQSLNSPSRSHRYVESTFLCVYWHAGLAYYHALCRGWRL